MLLYHGSESIIERPTYGLGATTNDYGRGFYCTEHLELAKEWACARGQNGFANGYELDTTGLRILDLNGPDYSVLHWLAVLAKHRTYWENNSISAEAKQYLHRRYYVDVQAYDLVKGYRADDSYFSFAQSFVANTLSLENLQKAMRLGELGEQIVLISQHAFSQIKFLGCERVSAEDYLKKALQRDRKGRKAYRAMARGASLTEGTYILDIMRRERDGAQL